MKIFVSLCVLTVSHVSLCLTVPGHSSGGFEVRNYRDYYIQAEKIEWDYLQYQQNLVDFYDE